MAWLGGSRVARGMAREGMFEGQTPRGKWRSLCCVKSLDSLSFSSHPIQWRQEG